MRTLVIILGGALFWAAGAASAEVRLSRIEGGVLINQGTGYRHAEAAVNLKTGNRIMVNPGAAALLTYSDGCKVPLRAGAVFSIGKASPCRFKAQGNNNENHRGPNPYLPYVVGGAAAILAGFGIYAIVQDDEGNNFVSVP